MSFRNILLSCLLALVLVQVAVSQAANNTSSGSLGTAVTQTFATPAGTDETTTAPPSSTTPVGSPRYLMPTYGQTTNQTNDKMPNAAVGVASGMHLLLGALGGVTLLMLAL